MLVRLIMEHRRGKATLYPGAILGLPMAEAMILIQDGIAVPAFDSEIERETR